MEVLIDYIVEILVGGFLALALGFLKSHFGMKANSEVAKLIKQGVGYGKRAAKRRLGEAAENVDFENETVDQAVKFVVNRAPKWLKMAGITEGYLRELVEGELENSKEK